MRGPAKCRHRCDGCSQAWFHRTLKSQAGLDDFIKTCPTCLEKHSEFPVPNAGDEARHVTWGDPAKPRAGHETNAPLI
jgi:hypothetical protein